MWLQQLMAHVDNGCRALVFALLVFAPGFSLASSSEHQISFLGGVLHRQTEGQTTQSDSQYGVEYKYWIMPDVSLDVLATLSLDEQEQAQSLQVYETVASVKVLMSYSDRYVAVERLRYSGGVGVAVIGVYTDSYVDGQSFSSHLEPTAGLTARLGLGLELTPNWELGASISTIFHSRSPYSTWFVDSDLMVRLGYHF